MTPEEIRANAPSGATHYADKYSIEYFKSKGKIIYVYEDGWHILVREQWGFIKSIAKPL